MNRSLNKKNHVIFDFDNFSERGLKSFLTQLGRAGAVVASVTASNKKSKRDGLVVKKATLFFDGGQRAELVIGSAGDIATLKVNGKSTPFAQTSTLSAFAKVLAKTIEKGKDAFDKSIAKKLKNVKSVSAVKPASKPLKDKTKQAEESLKLAIDNKNEILAAKAITDKKVSDIGSATSDKRQALALAKDKTKELRAKLASMEN